MKKALILPLFYAALASAAFAQSSSPLTESANRFLATLSTDELTKTQYTFT